MPQALAPGRHAAVVSRAPRGIVPDGRLTDRSHRHCDQPGHRKLHLAARILLGHRDAGIAHRRVPSTIRARICKCVDAATASRVPFGTELAARGCGPNDEALNVTLAAIRFVAGHRLEREADRPRKRIGNRHGDADRYELAIWGPKDIGLRAARHVWQRLVNVDTVYDLYRGVSGKILAGASHRLVRSFRRNHRGSRRTSGGKA